MKRPIKIIMMVIAVIIELYAAILAGMHGYYEIVNGHKNPGGILFDAISGNSLTTNFNGWPGWPAISIIPDLLITGIVVFIIDGILLVWFLFFNNHKKWIIILVCLAILLCVCGGGFMSPFYGITAGVIVIFFEKNRPKK
jgi:hypothetical protein